MARVADDGPPASVDGAPRRSRNPLRWLLDLFSSVRLGIVLMAILFVYASIGSAGVIYPDGGNIFSADGWAHDQLRQWRPFEMTEFEWFHWWPFDLLIALICINIVVTTLRRIRLSVVNLGVWMIHTGVIVLAIGSVIYFSTKVEGDVPVARRNVIIEVATPQGPVRGEVLAMPGNRTNVSVNGQVWSFEVTTIDPSWELLTGEDAGDRAYSVNVLVQGPQRRFIRQLIDGRPAYTEDLLFTSDPQQPIRRAVRETGSPIVEPDLTLSLAYAPATDLYLRNDLRKSWALYVRKPGETTWVQRPIAGLPLYNDYIASREEVIQLPGAAPLPIDPIDVPVPAVDPADPFADVTLHVTGYLRYATMRSQLTPGGPDAPINPVVWVTLALGERTSDYRLAALDPAERNADNGLLSFRLVSDEAQLEQLLQPPSLIFEIPGIGFTETAPVTAVTASDPSTPFIPLGDTGYRYRVVAVQDDVALASGEASVAIIELETPAGQFRRWVFDDPALTRDVEAGASAPAHGAPALIDDTIRVRYAPGHGTAFLTIVAGPDPGRLRAITAFPRVPPQVVDLRRGEKTDIGRGLSLRVDDYMPRAVASVKPLVVPREQRVREAGEQFARIRLEVPGQQAARFSGRSPWIGFNHYVFEDASEALRRAAFDPVTITLADGRMMEVLFSRQRLPLPAPIVLEGFRLTTHPGGFSGSTMEIRNYTSEVRFGERTASRGAAADAGGGRETWSDVVEVSVNEPVEHDGLWFFQAQWDPPDEARAAGDRASAGLNYTVLGVGNRNGVYVQLAGCIIAVIGMIYAFYVKPVIKRRRQAAVLAEVERLRAEGRLPVRGAAPRPAVEVN